MEQDNAHHDPPDKEGARWAGRDDCGLPEHPDLSWAGAAEFIRARTRWDLPRTHGPMLPRGGSPDRQRRAVPGGADQAVRHLAGVLGARRRSGHPHHKTQAPGHRGQIRPTSSSPCTPEPARRRKPAELTPVAMPVLKSPGRTARRRQPPILSEPTSWHDRNRAEPDPMRAASRQEGMTATAPESAGMWRPALPITLSDLAGPRASGGNRRSGRQLPFPGIAFAPRRADGFCDAVLR